MKVPYYDSIQIDRLLRYDQLIDALNRGLQDDLLVPDRMHYHLDYQLDQSDPTLLVMPAWKNKAYIGIKIVTVFPQNVDIPTIQGMYVLMDGRDGRNLAFMDAKLLTLKRTAAISALMSRYLSRSESRRLLMVGTGNLAPELIRAHCQVRPIDVVQIWGRNADKAKHLLHSLDDLKDVRLEICEDLKGGCQWAHVISVATMAIKPIVYGQWINPGSHVDLVGSYKSNTREADNDLIRKASVFVDTISGASRESGDLAIPLKMKVIDRSHIRGTMFDLCKNQHPGRTSDREVTVFKSVGHASEDLIAAYTLYEHREIRD